MFQRSWSVYNNMKVRNQHQENLDYVLNTEDKLKQANHFSNALMLDYNCCTNSNYSKKCTVVILQLKFVQ